MRKSASIYLLLSLLFLTALSLQAQTRPRRVGDTVSNPPETQPTPQAPPTQKRPVLQTGTTISSSGRPTAQSQTQTANGNAGNEPEEVGEGDVVRVSTTLVSIPVSVMDRNGRFIPDLQKQDFQIY